MLFHSNQENNPPETWADLKAARSGDTRAFGRLVAPHQEIIYSLSYRVLGDEQIAVEAAQTGVSRAAQNFAKFGSEHFQLWLLHWVVAACQERLPNVAPAQAAETETGKTNSTAGIQSSLCGLPFSLRLTLILVDVIGLDYSEAATVLRVPRERVGQWLAQARARLMSL